MSCAQAHWVRSKPILRVTQLKLHKPTIVIVIVNSRFLERPQKRSCGNQLIHRHLTKTKLIGSGQDPESQVGRQSDGYIWWMVLGVKTGREIWGIRIGFAKEQCFQFGMKELWRDGKGRGLSELVGWVRHLSQCWREFVPERRGNYRLWGLGEILGRRDKKDKKHFNRK